MGDSLVGLYPGTFDPVTGGHMDIIRRAIRIVDSLVVGVAINDGKGPLFGLDDRVDMLNEEIADALGADKDRVTVRSFDNLLMHFAQKCGARVIVRGLRAVSDFEYEFQMAGMNARMNPEVETVFLMASEKQTYVSSRFVKEIARLGGDVGSFVSPSVKRRLEEVFGR